MPRPGAAHAARAGDPLDGRPKKAEHLTRRHARLLLLILVAAVVGIRAAKRSQAPAATPVTTTARPERQEPSAAPRPSPPRLAQPDVAASEASSFPVGRGPAGVAFDGTSIWVANQFSDTVTELRILDGRVVERFRVGKAPAAVAFDGTHIWVPNSGSNTVSKRQAVGPA